MGFQHSSSTLKRIALVGGRALSVLSFFGLSAYAFAGDSVQIISQPGDYIGQGAQQTFTTVTAETAYSQSVLSFTAGGFTYQFETPDGVIAPGIYEDATRYPFNNAGVPGLSVYGNGRGCNELYGRFIVHELTLGAGTAVTSAAIDFEQHCAGGVPALYGFIRYNSTLGVVDQDGDGVADIQDNCPATVNADQMENDGDKIGDACDPILGVTQVTFKSAEGDYIGQGKVRKFTMVDGGVRMSRDTNPGIARLTAGDFDIEFSAGDVNSLTVGTYKNATRYPFNTGTEPGLSVYGEGRGCGQVTGSFRIFQVLRGNDGLIKHFAADFEQSCDGGPLLKGEVRFNAEIQLPAEKSGSTVAFVGDVNGDGYGDYAVGIPGYDLPAVPPAKPVKDAGAAKVLSGKNGAAMMMITGTKTRDAMGAAVAGNGDIDGDGYADVVVGAPMADPAGQVDAGSVTILYGPAGIRKQVIPGVTAKALFGAALALGDVDADGHADVIVGAPKDDDSSNGLVDAGSVTMISGSDTTTVLRTVYGETAKAMAGSSVATGDVNNDGKADVLLGAPNDDSDNALVDAGSVTVYGQSGPALWKKSGAAAKAFAGKAVASGDVDHDGNDDVLVGAPGDDSGALKDAGSIAVLSGLDGHELVKKYGATAKLNLGTSVAAGDVNGDGFAEIMAGVPKDDKPTSGKPVLDAGSVSVWNGNGYGDMPKHYGNVTKDYFGLAVSAGDTNNDGRTDVVVGVPGFDIPATPKPVVDVGSVQVLSGSGF